MTRRIRNTIIDNTTGKVLSGTDVSTDTSEHVVAALVPKQVSIEVKSPGSLVQVVNATKAWKPSSSGIITKITAYLRTTNGAGIAAAADGPGVTFRIRQQTALGSATLYTYNIPSGSFSLEVPVGINFLSTDNIYIDVTQAGSTKSGTGLVVYLEYFIG